MDRKALDFAWQKQSVWSQVAGTLKARLQTMRLWALGLATVGALLSTTAAVVGLSSGPGKVLAFLGAAVIALVALPQILTKKDSIEKWTRARSVSEAIKTEVYLTLAGFGPADLQGEVDKILADADDLAEHTIGVTAEPRDLPDVHDVESYFGKRVDQQITGYYEPSAARLKGKAARFRQVEFVLIGIGAVIAAAAGTWEIDGLAAYVPVVTTVGAAIAAHAAAARYSYLVVEYTRTAEQLRRIRDKIGEIASYTDEQRVVQAEKVISIQNEGWMAKLTDAGTT